MPSLVGIHHVALTVTNLAVSEKFYSRLWSLDPVATLELDGFVRRIYRPAPGLTVGLTQHDAGLQSPFSPLQPGLDHLGFACTDRAALDEWVEHLDAIGIDHSPIIDAGFGLALVVKDPDGIALEFYVAARPAGI